MAIIDVYDIKSLAKALPSPMSEQEGVLHSEHLVPEQKGSLKGPGSGSGEDFPGQTLSHLLYQFALDGWVQFTIHLLCSG